jgi:hypothetical protein
LNVALESSLPNQPERSKVIMGFDPRSGHVEFVVNKVALGQVFSEYFGFPCQSSSHQLLHNHHLSSGAGQQWPTVANVPSGLSLTPPRETKKKVIVVAYIRIVILYNVTESS